MVFFSVVLLTDVPREGPKSEPRLLLACDGHVVSFLSFVSLQIMYLGMRGRTSAGHPFSQ
jgi:hypothetical protein